MSPDDWPARFTEEALAQVDAFIAAHPGYAREGVEQPSQGATNRVIFGRRGDELVVFKVFCEEERKERELFGLLHWRATGLVPQIVADAGERMIVMSHVPGMGVHVSRDAEPEAAWAAASRDLGRALGTLARVPLSGADRAAFETRFYGGLASLEAYLGRILALGRSIHARDADFRDGFWRASLDFAESQMPRLLSERRVLYHQDAGNHHVLGGRFTGFFDLEMCRVGCGSMQFASALLLPARGQANWTAMRQGWEAATGAALDDAGRRAALAGFYLLGWREISRYLSYDGTPGTGFDWAEPADPARYRREIEAVHEILEIGPPECR